MRTLRLFALLAAGTGLCALPSFSQDSQSIADAARQARQQKQQKEAPATNPNEPSSDKAPHVITNDEIPEHMESTALTHTRESQAISKQGDGTRKTSAEQWKSQIQAQKSAIAALQREIKSLADSIHFPESCLPHTCAQRNQRQLNKESRVDTLNHQLEQQQKRLEELQESARRQGFGSAVYDP